MDLTRRQDDVMPKPFRVSELLAKMEALKRISLGRHPGNGVNAGHE